MYIKLSKNFHFEAAHWLPTFPKSHKCHRLHGHSFKFEVVVAGEVDPELGYLMDYGQIKKKVEPLVDQLDHYCLNDIQGLENPTAENLAAWLYHRLEKTLPLLSHIVVYETCTSSAEYHGE